MSNLSVKFQKHTWQFKTRDMADASVVSEIFKWREYRAAEGLLMKAKNAIIDVGAHIGVFSLYCRALNDHAPIFAMEPDPQNLLFLKDNLALNHLEDIHILPQALAATAGERELLISVSNINHRLLLNHEQKNLAMHLVKVPATSLAELPTKKIDLIKLDIEGGEFEVLKRTPDQFLKIPRAWLLEYHDSPEYKHALLANKLKTLGYGVQHFPSRFDKKLGFLLATRH